MGSRLEVGYCLQRWCRCLHPTETLKNDNSGADVSTDSTVSTENERNKILEDFQVQDESLKEI